MALLDYTSYDEVRAVLGVSSDELEDATLALGVYSSNLNFELEGVSLQLPASYSAVVAIASGSRTAVQQRLYDATRLFATYAVAKQLGTSLPLFGPKDITDGKSAISRFADSPYKETLKNIEGYYNRTRLNLEDAFAKLNLTEAQVVTRKLLTASSPTSDPVIGT